MSSSAIDRSSSLAVATVGAVSNVALAVYLLGTWRTLVWEPGSEWEGSRFSLSRDGARLICGLFSAYFAAASAICVFGLVGIVKRKPSFVRIYRNYVIGDFAFCTLFAILASSAAVDPAMRAQACEQISSQPDLLRSVIDLGLTLENCEQWFERGLMAFMTIFLVRTAVRIHFIITLSRYYSRLTSGYGGDPSCTYDVAPLERIYLLPPPPVDSGDTHPAREVPTQSSIYAPVLVSPQRAQQLRATATEVWVSRVASPCHARAWVTPYDENDHLLNDVQTRPSVGPIHLKETC